MGVRNSAKACVHGSVERNTGGTPGAGLDWVGISRHLDRQFWIGNPGSFPSESHFSHLWRPIRDTLSRCSDDGRLDRNAARGLRNSLGRRASTYADHTSKARIEWADYCMPNTQAQAQPTASGSTRLAAYCVLAFPVLLFGHLIVTFHGLWHTNPGALGEASGKVLLILTGAIFVARCADAGGRAVRESQDLPDQTRGASVARDPSVPARPGLARAADQTDRRAVLGPLSCQPSR